ncbi:hypothetical protein [Lacibacter sp.]|uniref:hypothetical protein n=1 Tax=Lacibacter sp. TaxID=1915409 RepID=UPI002B4B5305|nr:hypothetical protein [Lacibacter sp.]HLP37179.1 hypothetical protein [Lacibacter sp.]
MLKKQVLLLMSLVTTLGYQSSAQTSTQTKYTSVPDLYAGIEVGSKGVKLSVIEMKKNKETGNSFSIVKDTSFNTDFISFTQPTFDATATSFAGMFQTAVTKFNIPSKRVFTVISSGVKIQAEKENKKDWVEKLIKEFRSKVNEPQRKVEVVDVQQEAKLSHQGIVPLNRRYNTFLIDIGSGNSKGGFFPYGNDSYFYLFQLSWGTKSTANAAEKMCGDDKSHENYTRQLFRVAAGAENSEIAYTVNTSGSYPVSDHIAFSGGIAWATATLLYPELNNNPVLPVTYEDVERFHKRVTENYSSFSESYLMSKLTNGKWDKKLISSEVKRVHAVFDQRSLMAGSALLLRIMRQFKSVNEAKQFYLIKNGQVGWVSAYVDAAVE